jgi:oligopeptide/dipeptide ABC transporter ATP-binding protein
MNQLNTSNALLEILDLKVGIKREERVINILDGVSFFIKEGESLGIVGESGSGKSTMGLSVLRLTPHSTHPHTSGQILFKGRDILAMDDTELQKLRGKEISMILQDPMTSLNPVFRIGDQVAEAIESIGSLSDKDKADRVINALERVQIPAPETRVDAWPHQLSGGMKQRVVGAIALASQPKLLIADEPTTALDVTIQAQYLQLLKDLQQEFNMALMFITHDFGVVARMCDRVCVMYAGQIVETASVHTIFDQPAHWYTEALIGGVPSLDGKLDKLVSIPGAPPKLGETTQGCRFSARCPNSKDKCQIREPDVMHISDTHEVKCWYPREQ